MRETRNAVIESVSIDVERSIAAWINLNYGGAGQGFGGMLPGNNLAIFIRGVLKTLEIERWEDLKGKPCRVDQDNGKVYRIGHYLNNVWFDPDVELEK